jgi:hypothetical protein
MSVLAYSSSKEKIKPCLQGPWSGAWEFHPLRMPSKMGSSFPLTFFVMFCHAHTIGAQEAAFNNNHQLCQLKFGSRFKAFSPSMGLW